MTATAIGAARTWINSTGVWSPAVREANTLVAGNALGEMLIDLRFRALLMTSDAMDTKDGCVSAEASTIADERGASLATTHIESGP